MFINNKSHITGLLLIIKRLTIYCITIQKAYLGVYDYDKIKH